MEHRHDHPHGDAKAHLEPMDVTGGHSHRALGYQRLRIAIILTAVVMVVEIIGGIFAQSLALISDAGHMLTHLFALVMSFFAIILAARPATKEKTYGFYRAEVLAAFVNGIVLLFITGFLVYKAILRMISPVSVDVKDMLLVAFIGLVANGISIFLLREFEKKDLNIRSAFLHVIGDTFSSVVIVIGGLIMYYTHNYIVDPILTILISILILIWAGRLLKESGNILLEAAPAYLDILEISKTIQDNIKEIKALHDLHVWVITSHMYALTAHVIVDDCQVSACERILSQINALVKEKFNISHTNIQFECAIKK
jgi:cobalt-zinc-cadmium efflux system protein